MIFTAGSGARGAAGRAWRLPLFAAAVLAALPWRAGAEEAPEKLLQQKCGACHLEGGKLQRIGEMRKTPEGWDMSIARMGVWHKVEVSKEERKALVKYLSDRQGLAPAEAAPYRFLLERVPNSQDVLPSAELGQMCGRCHSFGRVALQRRDEAEWRKLIHTHVGQFPSIEYSAFGRDRNWWDIARDQTAKELAALYPKESKAWRAWKAKPWKSAAGTWRVAGHRPGLGDYSGYMTVKAKGRDRYEASYELTYAGGETVRGEGESIVYTGYEWRGSAKLGEEAIQSVFAIAGDRMTGRWFRRQGDEIGARFSAVRVDKKAAPTVLAVTPALIKVGETTRLKVQGINLGARVDLGPGIEVLAVERRQADEIEMQVKATEAAKPGLRRIGKGRGAVELAIYREIDSLRVEPAFAIARVGGGTLPKVAAQFEAIAYSNGPDGKPGTEDDIRLGTVPATWRTDNHDDKAKEQRDADFAGRMEATGLFVPAAAGPNPERAGLNNVGDLKVIATAQDGGRQVDGEGRLVVTVQRWNTPPLR